MYCLRLAVLSFITWLLLCISACNDAPSKVYYSQLKPVAYYKDEVRDGVTYHQRLRQKPFIYQYDGKPYTGSVKDYFDENNEHLRSEGNMKNGFPDGYWKYYTLDGNVQMEGKFIEGNADSIWHKYFRNGNTKTIERYTIKNDTIRCDTLMAWYSPNKPFIRHVGDTTYIYYENGKLAKYAIGNPVKSGQEYNQQGELTAKTFDYQKEVYGYGLTVKQRIFYIHTPEGRANFLKRKYTWSKEQSAAIQKADSVEFDYYNPYDVIIKIYTPE